MQSSSSVPVLILVLCCMASADNDIYNSTIHDLEEEYENCSFHTFVRCRQAEHGLFSTTDSSTRSLLLDMACSETCIEAYGECFIEFGDFLDFVCVKHNSQYCYIIYHSIVSCLEPNGCYDMCTDACCCLIQWERMGLALNGTIGTSITDVCGNTCNSARVDDGCNSNSDDDDHGISPKSPVFLVATAAIVICCMFALVACIILGVCKHFSRAK